MYSPLRTALSTFRPMATKRFLSSASSSGSVPRHFLSISDLSPSELSTLVRNAASAKKAIKSGDTSSLQGQLTGKTIAMLFSKRSTRTRVSTEAAVAHMSGHPMFLGKDDIQLGVNETLYDTSKVISSMTSCMVVRCGPHSDILELSANSSVPVINALSSDYHPLQAVTDILTIYETFPEPKGIKLAWVGDANNVLNDLMMACAKLGINVSVATPKEYPVDAKMLADAQEAAKSSGATIETTTVPEEAVKGAKIIVTDTWISMGQESEKALRLKQFAGFQVSLELAEKGGADKDWRFMHCLPRKPEEVTDEVFYSDRSLVFPEAENRLYAAVAALQAFVVNKGKIE